MEAVEHFSAAFSAKHQPWASSNYAWDPSSLVAVPGPDGVRSSPSVEGDNGTDADRDQSLGPQPTNWKAPGARNTSAESKAHARLPKMLVCQVEGCGHDLSSEKGYYQRYRICEPHVKLLTVEVEGRACRFCQQCGRFHELSEFDGTKRSCRARLLLHNARRRKRDPVDASNTKEPRSQRKAKATHPRSDDSNDNELDSRGSFGASHGNWPASGAPTSTPVVDAEPAPAPAVSSGAVPKLMSRSGVNDQSLPLPGFQQPMPQGQVNGAQAPATLPPALTSIKQEQPEPMGLATGAAAAAAAGPVMQRESLPVDFARAFSDDTDLPLVDALKLDDFMLDGIMPMDYIDELPAARPLVPNAEVGLGGPAAAAGLSGNGRMGGLALFEQQQQLVQMQQQQQQQVTFLQQQQQLATAGPAAGYSPMLGPDGSMMGAGVMPPAGMAVTSMPRSCDINMSPAVPRAVLNEQLQMQQIADAQRRLLQSAGVLPGPSHQGTFLAEPAPVNDGPNSGMSVCSMGGGFTSPSSSSVVNPLGSGFSAAPHPNAGSHPRILSSGVTLNVSSAMASAIHVGPGMAQAQTQAPFGAVGGGGGMSSFDMARRLVAGGGAGAQYRSDDFLMRVSIKVANCTPNELPPDLYQRLQSLLATADASLIQGFLRPGCVHLVLDVRGSQGAEQALSAAGVRAALGPVAQLHSTLVQVGKEVAMWAEGASTEPTAATCVEELEVAGAVPVLQHVSLAAHLRHSEAGDGSGSARVLVYGSGLLKAGVQLFARMQGGYLPVRVQPLVAQGQVVADGAAAAAALQCMAQLAQAGRSAADVLLVTVAGAPASGLLLLEAQAGPLLSAWRPCLLSVDSAIANELTVAGAQARAAGGDRLQSLERFVTDLGRLVDACSFAKAGSTDAEEEAVSIERVCACEQLLAWSAEAGLPAVSGFLVHTLLRSGHELGAVLETPYADGFSVLHRAVRSRNDAMLRAVLGWSAREGVELSWRGDEAVGQLSPLHLAAMVPVAWRALKAEPAVQAAWASVRAADGATPALLHQILFSRLTAALNARSGAKPVAEIAVAAGTQAAAAAQTSAVSAPPMTSEPAAHNATATVAAPVPAALALPPAMAVVQPVNVLGSALPLMAVLAALTYASLAPIAQAPYLPVIVATCVLAYALRTLLTAVAAQPTHAMLMSQLGSQLPPMFASAQLEAAYITRAAVAAVQAPRDAAALLVLLAMSVAAARLPGASAFGSAVNAGLTLLPLAAMRLSRQGYSRVRDMALVGAYVAMLNATCALTQGIMAGSPRCCCAMLFTAITMAASIVTPVNTVGMLFTLAYAASMALRAWTQQEGLIGGAFSVTAAEACGAAQLAVTAAATAVSYARELAARQQWLACAGKAALGK
ncbi:hypothetical protein HYH02_000415 [Chlamydomonas schloesseri]|uniref:SBP-type domain-containing protein n=1 Tax=Chlamydomonas schloesseri TaxID=2026947 RepID=A0A835WVM3_9CHLO|nr:hypothetical protein HYH02_000415 [Chlamydomonas schloesseri]|eukprot:KAG2454570.1 hypothetical protein HYH02_000415 [Chlamydomonas schloesseri]